MMRVSGKRLLAARIAILIAFMSCREALPVYREPQEILMGAAEGWYDFSLTRNSLYVRAVIVNAFDETLEGKGPLRGTLQVVSARDTSFRKTFNLAAGDLTRGDYDRTTGVLRIDPGDTVMFAAEWTWIDDAGRDLKASLFQYAQDLSCPGRLIARNEIFFLSGSFFIYDKTGTTVLKRFSVSLCHVTHYDRNCSAVEAWNACSFRSGGS